MRISVIYLVSNGSASSEKTSPGLEQGSSSLLPMEHVISKGTTKMAKASRKGESCKSSEHTASTIIFPAAARVNMDTITFVPIWSLLVLLWAFTPAARSRTFPFSGSSKCFCLRRYRCCHEEHKTCRLLYCLSILLPMSRTLSLSILDGLSHQS